MAVMPLTLIFVFLMLAGVLALAFTVFSCVWLYRDSRLHGQPPALWVLLAVFAGPIIALLLYFIFGRTHPGGPLLLRLRRGQQPLRRARPQT